jgi:hypothetical protein
MNHVFEVQLSLPKISPKQKSFLKSLGKRFEKHHNRGAKQLNAEGFKMIPFIECMQTRFLPKRICKLLGNGERKVYIVFRLYHTTVSEQNMAVHQLKKEMGFWRDDLRPAVSVKPVQSYKTLYFANAHMILYCKFARWAQEQMPEATARGTLIYSL